MTTDSDPGAVLAEHLCTALRQAGRLSPTGLVTNAVAIAQTVEDGPDGLRYDVHRVYPIGAIDPSTERGLLRDALHDADAERHPPQ